MSDCLNACVRFLAATSDLRDYGNLKTVSASKTTRKWGLLMKKLIVATIASVLMMAGSAYAGCQNGSHAAAESETPLVATADVSDSRLLTKFKAQEEAKELEKLIGTTPSFN